MIEPIHIQTNILGTTVQSAEAQGQQTQLAGTQAAQAERARQAHETEQTRPPEATPDEGVENPGQGSGRGRGWLRQHREKKEEKKEEAPPGSAEPGKGERVDFKG